MGVDLDEIDMRRIAAAVDPVAAIAGEAGEVAGDDNAERRGGGDAGVVAGEAHRHVRRLPGQPQMQVLDGKPGVDDAEAGQVPHGARGVGRREQVGEQQFGRVPRRAGDIAEAERDAPVDVAHDTQFRLDDLEPGGRDDAAQHRRHAECDRKLGRGRRDDAVGLDNGNVDQADVEGAFPAGPGQDGVGKLDVIARIALAQRVGDIGREKAERDRPARQVPSGRREHDRYRGDGRGHNVENNSCGRANHVYFRAFRQLDRPRRFAHCATNRYSAE